MCRSRNPWLHFLQDEINRGSFLGWARNHVDMECFEWTVSRRWVRFQIIFLFFWLTQHSFLRFEIVSRNKRKPKKTFSSFFYSHFLSILSTSLSSFPPHHCWFIRIFLTINSSHLISTQSVSFLWCFVHVLHNHRMMNDYVTHQKNVWKNSGYVTRDCRRPTSSRLMDQEIY